MRNSLCEKGGKYLIEAIRKNLIPLSSAIVFGFIAHMYAFTNKLLNWDEINSLYSKGLTIGLGRWGSEATKLIFPNVSMPWIYGVVSLIILAVSACFIINIFEIKGTLIKAILSALVTTFPSFTGNITFMFTCPSFALAFFLSVLSVYAVTRDFRFKWVLSGLFLILSLSIYQAYLSMSAALFVVYIIKMCLDGEKSAKDILFHGLKEIAVLIFSVIIYLGITVLIFKLSGTGFAAHGVGSVNNDSILNKIKIAYLTFFNMIFKNEKMVVPGRRATIGLILCAITSIAALAYVAVGQIKRRKIGQLIIIVLCLVLLPLAIDCMYIAMSGDSIHTMVVFSFISVYILVCVLLDKILAGDQIIKLLCRDAAYVGFVIILINNIYLANQAYLKQYLLYENCSSFYTSLITRVEGTQGFDDNCKLALIGTQSNDVYYLKDIYLGDLIGVGEDLINVYSREDFIKYFIGNDIPIASQEEKNALALDPRFEKMSEYPYEGSIERIDDCIVVKLG